MLLLHIYGKIVHKMQYQHFYVSLFSNPWDNIQKRSENHGTNLSPSFNKNNDLVPWNGEEQGIEMLFLHFSNNTDSCVYVGK